jgi:hypothetical protein
MTRLRSLAMSDFNDAADESGPWAGGQTAPRKAKKRDWKREQAVARFYIAKMRAILAKPKSPTQGRLL